MERVLPEGIQAAFLKFCETVFALRDPKTGCPWDLKQDHRSLRKYMLEEAYEAASAMAEDSAEDICEELGDVLLQVVLNAQIACDQKTFSIVDVIEGINKKMISRHPHVFAPSAENQDLSSDDVVERWGLIKNQEKQKKSQYGKLSKSIVAESKEVAELKKILPSTTQAEKIGNFAKKSKFDWEHPEQVFVQLKSEVEELAVEIKSVHKKNMNKKKLTEELGDVYFTLAQLCRHYDIDPEICASDANYKFLKRFQSMLELATRAGEVFEALNLERKEDLWRRVKSPE
ncbi:MAG: nucleoside triphosphate pyrophosphohydrolase [Oligoflexales bacterium]|nr:nucleoside triphosphate pyrophosphohydrolase [Oligoflexales bacterium]